MSGAENDIKINAMRESLHHIEARVNQLDTHYVLDGEVALRPANPAALAGMVLSGLPIPSTVTINGITYGVDDGTLEMSFPRAGSYSITVTSPFPFLDASFTHTQ